MKNQKMRRRVYKPLYTAKNRSNGCIGVRTGMLPLSAITIAITLRHF